MSQDPFSMSSLTASILARTSGPACLRLRTLACDLADGSVAGDDLALAEAHLAHCPACRALLSNLRETTVVLPTFAQVAPGEAFAASVLARTHRLRPSQPPDQLVEAWSRFLRRPRAALESAYLATAAGLILTQIPLPHGAERAGTALVTRMRMETRTHLAGSTPQAWTARIQESHPARLLGPSRSLWHRFWSRLTHPLSRAGSACFRTLQDLGARLGKRQPAPARTEPSDASGRPAS